MRAAGTAIFTSMTSARRAILPIGAAVLVALCSAPSATLASATREPSAGAIDLRTLRASGDLWATINVCSPTDQPDTVGIRGSMPSDGKAKDKMYMSFRLQRETAAKVWVDLSGSDARTEYLLVGRAATRQDGASFQLVPVAGHPAMTLRGVVSFQWRRDGVVLATISRATSAGRVSLAGADPTGFSAASCVIG